MNVKLLDFTNAERVYRPLGGSDRKFPVKLDDVYYILKFTEKHEKHTDMSTSYLNCITSEYICSHISESAGLPTHLTVLGYYKKEPVVGCVDFRNKDESNMEFREFVKSIYDDKEVKRVIRLDQIYHTLESDAFPQNLKEASIERYWDTFVIDALVGNFDRHIGNWGYLANSNNELHISPVYDFGSSLFPQLSDEGIKEIIDNKFEMQKRCFVFPNAALYLTSEKVGKVGYYDMMSSGYDENCTKAVCKMVPKIDMNKVYDIIDNTPFITDIQKDFYKRILTMRKELVLDYAYQCCMSKKFDLEALDRLTNGKPFSEEVLKKHMSGTGNGDDENNHIDFEEDMEKETEEEETEEEYDI